MPRKRPIAILCLFFAIAGGSLVWLLDSRAKQREWPSVQMERGLELGALVGDYHSTHGTFPESLEALVHSGAISESKLHELRFQSARKKEHSAWIYRRPDSINDIAIISPEVVVPWEGSMGVYIAARADGGGEMIGGGKRRRVENLLETRAEQGDAVRPTAAVDLKSE